VYVQDNFTRGTVRDGNGFIKWFKGMHDTRSTDKQIAFRAEFHKIKFNVDMSLTATAQGAG